jgi:hypothetical protein
MAYFYASAGYAVSATCIVVVAERVPALDEAARPCGSWRVRLARAIGEARTPVRR